MDWAVICDIILKVVISVSTTAVTSLIGVVFGKLISKIKDTKIMNYVKQAVMSAEQLYPNQGVKRGTEKYNYVVECVLAKYPKLQNNVYLRSLIEGAVFALNNELEKIKDIKIADTDTVKTNEEPKNKTDEKLIIQI